MHTLLSPEVSGSCAERGGARAQAPYAAAAPAAFAIPRISAALAGAGAWHLRPRGRPQSSRCTHRSRQKPAGFRGIRAECLSAALLGSLDTAVMTTLHRPHGWCSSLGPSLLSSLPPAEGGPGPSQRPPPQEQLATGGTWPVTLGKAAVLHRGISEQPEPRARGLCVCVFVKPCSGLTCSATALPL